MKYLISVLSILISSYSQNAKTDFLKDLDFVYENLKETSSYKTQKDRQKAVDLKYKELLNQNSQLSTLESFVKLYELLDEIPDFHNEIYGNTENFPYDSLQNKDFLNNIRISPEYSIYPITKMNLDSLESVLSTRKTSDYEGIYHYKNYFKIAIRKRPDSLLEGIVLETKIPSWQRGETILYLLRKQQIQNIQRKIY